MNQITRLIIRGDLNAREDYHVEDIGLKGKNTSIREIYTHVHDTLRDKCENHLFIKWCLTSGP